LALVFLLFFSSQLYSQTAGDYQTRGDGNWNDNTKWQVYNGTGWVNCGAGDYPGATAGAGTVNILNSHDIAVTANVPNSIQNLILANGATSNGITFSGAFSLTVNGSITINPSITTNNRNKFINIASGILNATSVIITASNGDSRDAYILISTGTLNVSGNISMASTNVRTYLRFSGAGTINVGGTITGGGITSAAGGSGTAPTSGTVNYNNAGTQNIGAYTYYNLELSNGGDKNLTSNTIVNNSLVLTNGLLNLADFNLTLATNATLSGSFSETNMVLCSGTGSLIANFATGNTAAFTFPVGENTGTTQYSPVTFDFSANTNAGTVSINVVDNTHPASSSIADNYLSRYWNINTTGLTNYTYYIDFSYFAEDVFNPATESSLNLAYNQSGSFVEIAGASVNTLTHNITATGLTQATAHLNASIFSALDNLAPMFNYTVKSGNLGTTYDWIDCSNGTQLTDADIIDWDYSPLDDGRWAINWPFDFRIYNSGYTTANQIGITTNGFIRFDGIPSIDYSAATYYELIGTGTGFGQVLLTGITDAYFKYDEEKVFYKVTGLAPDRVLTIDFQNQGIYGNPYLYLDIQISFYETSNKMVLKVGNNNFLRDNADIGIHSGQTDFYHYWQDARYSTPYTWIEYTIPTFIPSPQDKNTTVDNVGITQPAAANIASSVNSTASAMQVFKFRVLDQGTDGIETKMQRLRIYKSATTNSADWSTLLGGVVFSNGSTIENGVVSVNPAYLDVEFDPGKFTVSNGIGQEVTMSIYIKNADQSQAGKTFGFYVNATTPYFAADYTGSQFANTFSGGNIVSNVFTISFTATKLSFSVQPPPLAYVNEIVNPIVNIAITDDAGNIATSVNTGTITLSNTDGISATGTSATISNGVAIFSSLTFTLTGGPFSLQTNNTSGYSDISSDYMTIAVPAILFEDNFTSDKGWTNSGTALWQRGAQNNTTFGPASDHTTSNTDNLCYGTKLNNNYASAGDAYLISPVFDLAGTFNAIVQFWMDMEVQTPTNGGTVQIRRQSGGLWGSWITIDQTDPGYLVNAPNVADIPGLDNGVEGWSGDVPAGDWVLTMIDLSNLTTAGLTGITESDIIQIQFWFGSTSTNTAKPGWYIDDFSITYSTFPGLWKKTAISNDWQTTANWDDNNVPDITVSVTIPSGAAFYPVVDETDECKKIIVKDGGTLTLNNGALLTVGQFVEVGEGLSGTFNVNGGTLNIGTSLHSQANSTINISGGTINTFAIRNSLNDADAEDFFNLSGGTINVSGNAQFGASSGGTMSGDFLLKIAGDYKLVNNTTTPGWTTISGGTIELSGISTSQIISEAGAEAVAFNMLINQQPEISTNGNLHIYNNLELSYISKFTASAINSVQIDGDFILRSEGKRSASLLDDENISVSGTSTIEKYIEAFSWHYLCIPITSTDRTTFHAKYLYYYDETYADHWFEGSFLDENSNPTVNSGWINPAAGALNTEMKGYAYYYYEGKINFSGVFHTGNKSISISNTPSGYGAQFDGWNLIGNPYPSAIDWDLADKTDIDGAVYFYNDDGTNDFDNYLYYVTGGGAPSPNYTTGISLNGASNIIPSGQGFFVRTTAASANFQIDNSMRLHDETDFYKSTPKSKPEYLKLALINVENKSSDEMAIRIAENATENFDAQFDAFKLFPKNEHLSMVYAYGSDGKELAVQSIEIKSETAEIPLGIICKMDGKYDLALRNFNILSTNVYLVDKFTGIITKAGADVVYTFYSNEGEFFKRFVLVFSTENIISKITEKENVVVITAAQGINLYLHDQSYENGIAEIYEISGKLLYRENVNKRSFIHFPMAVKSVYIVKIHENEQEFIQKVMW